ncbi:MAG: exo-alpha-sialidase [Chloroflexaceae bacterium]|nr:exo-alpha-sialidase [Chloroflexaceae bacterium]
MTRRKFLHVGSTLALLLVLFGVAAVPGYAGVTPAGPNVQITDGSLRDRDAARPAIAVQGTTLYATWQDGRDTGRPPHAIYFSRSTDGGGSWSANKRVSDAAFDRFTNRPAISVAPNGTIWIAWWSPVCNAVDGRCEGQDQLNDSIVALSTDGGQTFAEYEALDGNGTGRQIDAFPEIYAWDDRALLLTVRPTASGADVIARLLARAPNDEIERRTVAVSEGSGNGRTTGGFPVGPRMALAVRGNTVCAAWEDRRGSAAIYGACSTNRGDSFGANFQISPGTALNPRLALGPDGTLYASYQNVANGPIQLRRSGDNGATWDTPNQAFALGTGVSLEDYDMAVDPGGQLLLTASQGLRGLVVASSIDRGQRFTLSGRLDSGGNTNEPQNPRMAVGGGANDARAYLVWNDDRNRNDQIWSTRINLDSSVPSAPANLRVQGGDTSTWLTWDAASDPNGIAGYHVQRATSEAGPFTQITVGPVTSTGYRDVGLDTTRYFYRVLAVDSTGNPGPTSNVASGAATVGSGLNGLNGTIAYESAGDTIAVRSFGGGTLGQERGLGPGFTPAFSYDGQRLLHVVNANNQGSVVSRGLDGGNQQTLLNSDMLIGAIAPTRDPNVVGAIYMQRYIQSGGVCFAFEPRMMGMQPNQELFRVATTVATDMALSSDRGLLAYTSRGFCNAASQGSYTPPRLCIQNTATKAETCLNREIDTEDSDFVPNQNRLVFSANLTGQRELWRADVAADGSLSNLNQLTRGPAGQPSGSPRVSTDGTWVIFTRDTDAGPGENLVLHVVRLDGDGLRSLGVAGDEPAWSGGGPAPVQAPGGNRLFLPLVRR